MADKDSRSVSEQASRAPAPVVKVDRKTLSPVSDPALWYSPHGLYFLLVSVFYLCFILGLRFF